MSTWLFLLQLIPTLINLMRVAEQVLGDGTGTKKKAFVKDGIKQIIAAIAGTPSADQEIWKTIDSMMDSPIISGLIDTLASFLFPKK